MASPIAERVVETSVHVRAAAAVLWQEVTRVDIASFRHPLYLRALGVPKPLDAAIVTEGVGGARVAHFENGLRFSQEITAWDPNEHYAFTFRADPGFRVGWLLDLSNGPFRLMSGAYWLRPKGDGIELTLTTHYVLAGFLGALLRFPVAAVLLLFQRYLLRGIRRNAERRAQGAPLGGHA